MQASMEVRDIDQRLFIGLRKKCYEDGYEIYCGVKVIDDGREMDEFNEGEGGILSN